ncbi:MAG TPA: alpha/beta fold hydrolase [Micromonosporaceae bacterium]|nr:alpha/beta fold hydrolase [Micromonosporaceae bacterium]
MTVRSRCRVPMWMVAAIAVLASTALTVQASSGQASAGRAAPVDASSGQSPTALSWADCGDGFQCATLEVPLDHARPSGTTIRIALTRLPATGESRGSVVANAGVQAGGGGAFVRNFVGAFADIRRDFDVIGLDTRGVGSSDPLVRCTTYEENRQFEAPLSAELTVADRDMLVREATDLAGKCRERSAAILPYLSSSASARDLDRVRAALGEPRLRLIATSGGAVLGQTYLAMFPQRVASVVFDSPFDADQFVNDAFTFDVDQMKATERTMDTFFRWCAATPSLCAFGAGDPRGAFERLLAKTRQNRIDNPGRWDIVTDGSLIDFISGVMVFPAQWPAASQQLAAMDAQPVPPAPMPTGDDRGFAEYYSQTCLDRTFPQRLEAFDQQLRRSVAATRYLGGRYGYAEFKCRQWPADPAERYTGPFRNPGARPVLVLTATDDPLAPHAGARQVARRLGGGTVVVRGTGHIQLGQSPCTNAVVGAFLRTGQAPGLTTCSVPLPS